MHAGKQIFDAFLYIGFGLLTDQLVQKEAGTWMAIRVIVASFSDCLMVDQLHMILEQLSL